MQRFELPPAELEDRGKYNTALRFEVGLLNDENVGDCDILFQYFISTFSLYLEVIEDENSDIDNNVSIVLFDNVAKIYHIYLFTVIR